MKTNTAKFILLTVIFIVLFSIPFIMFGQSADPPPPPDNPDAPIDGGLSVLIAAGIGYGAKKIHDQRKKKQELIGQ